MCFRGHGVTGNAIALQALVGDSSSPDSTMKNKYDWKFIQKQYDSGLSTRQVRQKYGIAIGSFDKAKKRGDFVPRTLKQSSEIRQKKYPKKKLQYDGTFQTYKLNCRFCFNLRNFPDEFDFQLIKKYGWYKPSNRGNNLGGVSRDHMVSIKYGFLNTIDTKVISHPANCRLIIHNDNVSKGKKCFITIDQLNDRIRIWDQKYI